VARAYIENGLGQRPHPLRLFYQGPMFRYEKMQRGRYRQFSQLGVELLGAATPEADAEVLLALQTFLGRLGFDDLVILLNNLGDPEDRERYIHQLKEELAPHRGELCRDCQRRWDENPLRILDCKVERCAQVVAATTPIAETVSGEARIHVERVRELLENLGVEVQSAPRLVRGLDYYMRTVFEVVSPALGEHAVICGGGRYDRLISDLGGPAVPGVGFAIGEDRLVEVLPEAFRSRALQIPAVAVLPLGPGTAAAAQRAASALRQAGVRAEVEVTGRSLKAALKWASKIGARAAVILGETELARGAGILRDLERGEQNEVPLEELPPTVTRLLDQTRS
jgi:histidyl-tRNA synthetase